MHAAGLVYDGTKVVLAVLWELEGFNRPADIETQVAAIAASKETHHSVREQFIKYN